MIFVKRYLWAVFTSSQMPKHDWRPGSTSLMSTRTKVVSFMDRSRKCYLASSIGVSQKTVQCSLSQWHVAKRPTAPWAPSTPSCAKPGGFHNELSKATIKEVETFPSNYPTSRIQKLRGLWYYVETAVSNISQH
jgi:hypothetical protein